MTVEFHAPIYADDHHSVYVEQFDDRAWIAIHSRTARIYTTMDKDELDEMIRRLTLISQALHKQDAEAA